MRGFIIMSLVFLLLISFVIVEEIYINKVSNTMYHKMNFDNVKSQEDLNKIINKWFDEEKKLKFFINHKELEKITLDLMTSQSLYTSGDIVYSKSYMTRAREKIKNIPNY
jgi:hypothetical protein